MRGKTAEEVAQMAQQLYGGLEQVYRNPPVQAPQAPSPTPQRQVSIDGIGDDDVVSGRELKSILAQAGQNIGGNLASLYAMHGDTNLRSLQGMYKTEFQKYGPEIMGKVAGLPVEMRTPGNLETIVRLVRGDHLEELANERARELAGQQDPTFRSNGGSGSATPGSTRSGYGKVTDRDDIPAMYRDMMQKKGITDETVREFAKANNETVEQWLEKAKRYDGNLITERSTKRGGQTTNG